MDNIRDIVKQVIGSIANKDPYSNDKLERLLENILDARELKHTCITGINEGRLQINVDSPALLFQMNIKKNRILNRLKEEDCAIKSISFKMGKVR